MKMIMHYQKTKITEKGSKVYIGEDARPYVNGNILAVADGLGGRGGYPHTKVNPEILDKDKFFDLFFADAFDCGTPDEEFIEHIYKSFNELFLTKDYFFESYDTIRTSGYYASRLFSIVTLYLLKYSEEFNADALFSRVNEIDGVEQKELHIQEFCDKLAEVLKVKVQAIADKVGLQRESIISGAYLLPSTLTVAITNEKENSVDVIYLLAGDTRGYFWTENGLMQITEDHEKFETMTNLITLTKPFKIEGAFVGNLPKPCILFNSSDGCYKCNCFASPFDLEYIFIDAINRSEDFEGAAKILQDTFKIIGLHDDSNTMALQTYGFEDYESVKKAVQKRLANIQETIVDKLPGILEIDYAGEKIIAEKALLDEIANNAAVLENAEISKEIIQQMIDEGYAPLIQAVEDKLSLKSDEYKNYVNGDNISTKELIKKYYETTKEEELALRREGYGRLYKLIEKNYTSGVNFDLFAAYVKFSKDETSKVKENNGPVLIFEAITKRVIDFDGKVFTYKIIERPVPEEDKAEFVRNINIVLGSGARNDFTRIIDSLTKLTIKDYYKEKGAQLSSQIFKKHVEKLKEIKNERLQNALTTYETADRSLAIRANLYAEYEVNYKKLYRRTKLNG